MKKILFLMCSLFTFFSVAARDIFLVKEGVPVAEIVVGEKPTKSAQLGAYELQHVVRLITGATLPIVSAPNSAAVKILLGDSKYVQKINIHPRAFKCETIQVKTIDNNIILTGKDSLDFGKVDYAKYQTFPTFKYRYNGTLFAVYDFLEQAFGVRFYMGGDIGIARPKLKTLKTSKIDFIRIPKVDAQRRISNSGYMRLKLSRRDMALLQMRWRHIITFGEINHNMYSIYFRYWDKAQKKYPVKEQKLPALFIEKRHDYFAKGFEGKYAPGDKFLRDNYPHDPDLPPQVCFSHPDVIEYYAQEAATFFNGGTVIGTYFNFLGYRRTPLEKMTGKPFTYPVQGADVKGFCQCKMCQSKFRDLPEEERFSNLMFGWTSKVARRANELAPGCGLGNLAYGPSLYYPEKIQMPENVTVQICPYIAVWWHPNFYAAQHGMYKRWIEKEAKKRPLEIWTYLFGSIWDGKNHYQYKPFPGLYPQATGKIFSEFFNDGIRGLFLESTLEHNFLEAYVAIRLAYDQSVSYDKLIDEYYEKYYGNAAPFIKAFYKEIESAYWNYKNYPKGWFRKGIYVNPKGAVKKTWGSGMNSPDVNWAIGTSARMRKIDVILKKCEEVKLSDDEKQRVDFLYNMIWKEALIGHAEYQVRKQYSGSVKSSYIPVLKVDEALGKPENVDFSRAHSHNKWFSVADGVVRGDKKMTIAMACDKKYLYIDFNNNGPAGNNIGVWHNNVELFFATEKRFPVYHMAFAPNGEKRMYIHTMENDVKIMNEYDFKPVIVNNNSTNNWSFRMAIALEKLPAIKSDSGTLKMLFARGCNVPKGDVVTWTPIITKQYIQSLDFFGNIGFPYSRKIELGDMLEEPKHGKRDKYWSPTSGFYKPHGPIHFADGKATVDSTKIRTGVLCCRKFEVFPGDKVTVKCNAMGKGTANINVHLHNPRGMGVSGVRIKNKIELATDPVSVSGTKKLPTLEKKYYTFMRFSFEVEAGGKATFSNPVIILERE